MPRDLTHVILADEAAETIKSNEIFGNMEAFHMGCVTDDAFLYTFSPKLSTKLHGGFGHDTREIVINMMDHLREEKNPVRAAEKKAFICGYVCHMAADSVIHPFIYSISGSQVESNNPSHDSVELSKACHRYAETWLDLHLMKKKNLTFKNFKPFRKIMKKVAMRIRLDDFFTDSFQLALNAKKYTWGDNFDLQAQFHNGMTRQFAVDEVTQNKTIGSMMRKLDKVSDGKLKMYASGFYNLDTDIPQRLTVDSFTHPVTGETVHKSIDDLTKEAVESSVKLIHAVDEYIKSGNREIFLTAVQNLNMDTGRTGQLKDIKKVVTQEDYDSIKGENTTSSDNTEDSFNLLRFFKKRGKSL